jgi:hypothetical protein
MSPQMAVAAMIIALISLLVISRFGSVGNLTTSAEQKVESLVNQGQQKINGAGAMAISGLQRVSYGVSAILSSGAATGPTAPAAPAVQASPAVGPATNSSPEPNRARGAAQPPHSEQAPDSTDHPDRDTRRKRQNP